MENEDADLDDAAVLGAVRANVPASTREVAEALGCSRRAAEYRLRELYARGELESEAVGRELVWRPAVEDVDRNG